MTGPTGPNRDFPVSGPKAHNVTEPHLKSELMKFTEDKSFRSAFMAKDPQAVDHFVGHFVPLLRKMAELQGLNHEEAQDTVQESFIVLLRKLSEIREDVRLSTFLFGVFTNCVREARRKRGRAESHGDLSAVEHLIDQHYDGKGHWKPGVVPLPLDHILAQENQLGLLQCLEGLPERHKAAVLISLEDEGTPQEQCHILGVSYANFRQLLTRARHALRLCLENYAKGGT